MGYTYTAKGQIIEIALDRVNVPPGVSLRLSGEGFEMRLGLPLVDRSLVLVGQTARITVELEAAASVSPPSVGAAASGAADAARSAP